MYYNYIVINLIYFNGDKQAPKHKQSLKKRDVEYISINFYKTLLVKEEFIKFLSIFNNDYSRLFNESINTNNLEKLYDYVSNNPSVVDLPIIIDDKNIIYKNEINEYINKLPLKNKTKVLVGLSGGVDSAVAAYLLKEEGYDVSCCFMRNWDSALNNDVLGNDTLNDEICTQEADYNDAKKVADSLGLELLRIDFMKEYWDNVFNNFVEEYKKGRTPNPDILCNKYIKFDSFLKFAIEKGFDKIATGHYIKEENGNYYQAFDQNKDQSYFLAQVDKKALDKCLFPLGDIDKTEVRRIAKELNLDIAEKKDSTGICFIGERNFREFLKNYIPMKEGKIIDIDTLEEVGKHDGVYYYTIGQRKGFGVGGNKGPYYCVGKDVKKNILYLTSVNNESYLDSDSALIVDINWIEDIPNDLDIQCKFRYRQSDNEVHIHKNEDGTALLTYPQKIKAVTPGQQAVFYLNGELLGGGTIDKTYNDDVEISEYFNSRVIGHING